MLGGITPRSPHGLLIVARPLSAAMEKVVTTVRLWFSATPSAVDRRNKFDPLWNSLVVAGFKDGQSCATPSACTVAHDSFVCRMEAQNTVSWHDWVC